MVGGGGCVCVWGGGESMVDEGGEGCKVKAPASRHRQMTTSISCL